MCIQAQRKAFDAILCTSKLPLKNYDDNQKPEQIRVGVTQRHRHSVLRLQLTSTSTLTKFRNNQVLGTDMNFLLPKYRPDHIAIDRVPIASCSPVRSYKISQCLQLKSALDSGFTKVRISKIHFHSTAVAQVRN
jgi:hypothetical protein